MNRSRYIEQRDQRSTVVALPATYNRTIDYRFLAVAALSALPVLVTAALVLGGPLAG